MKTFLIILLIFVLDESSRSQYSLSLPVGKEYSPDASGRIVGIEILITCRS